jgi:hypothetical protein
MLSSQKIVSLFLVLSSLYVAMAQVPSGVPSVSTVTNQAQCKKEGLALYAERREADCGQKTGQALQNCNEAYNIVPAVIKYACKQYKGSNPITISRQSPVDMLLTENVVHDGVTSASTTSNGRVILNANTGYLNLANFVDQSLTLEFETDESNKQYFWRSTGAVRSITINGDEFTFQGVDMKNPSEHTYSGREGLAEIQFIFTRDPDTDEYDPDTIVIMSFLVDDFQSGQGSPPNPLKQEQNADCTGTQTPFDDLLNIPLNAGTSVTVTVTEQMASYFYKYAGSLTSSPYTARTIWLMAAAWMNTATGPSWERGTYNYPDRPPVRALFSELHMMRANTNPSIVNGCTNYD